MAMRQASTLTLRWQCAAWCACVCVCGTGISLCDPVSDVLMLCSVTTVSVFEHQLAASGCMRSRSLELVKSGGDDLASWL